MNIITLDDSPFRQKWFEKTLGGSRCLAKVETAGAAIALLKGWTWDELYLDHDLGATVNDNPAGDNTGMAVVRHIEQHSPVIGRITIHTQSDHGLEMATRLLRRGYYVRLRSFPMLVKDAERREGNLGIGDRT